MAEKGDLTRAVALYARGQYAWPREGFDQVEQAFGRRRAAELKPAIEALFSVLERAVPDWTRADSPEHVDQYFRALAKEACPELEEPALKAIGSLFSYLWK